MLSDILARRFRLATARYHVHFNQKTITIATGVLFGILLACQ